MKFFIFSILLCFFSIPAFSKDCLEMLVVRTLVQQSLRPDTYRRKLHDWNEFYLLYKNNDQFAAWLRELPENDLKLLSRNHFPSYVLKKWKEKQPISSGLKMEPKTLKIDFENDPLTPDPKHSTNNTLDAFIERFPEPENPHLPEAPLSVYDIKVASLRKGDWVSYGTIKVRLGNFLGAGGTTHIYDLPDFPGHAIRIPFNVETVANPVQNFSFRKKKIKNFLNLYLNCYTRHRKTGVNIINLKNGGPKHGFFIVEKINGSMNGREYFEKFISKTGRSFIGKLEEKEFKRIILLMNQMRDPEVLRMKALLDETMKIREEHLMSNASGLEQLFRQFVWDEKNSRWVLVDWE